MTATSYLRTTVITGVILALMSGGLEAQFGPLTNRAQAAQARSQEELDSYLEIVNTTDPQTIVLKVKSFAAEFSKSELLSAAYQYQLQAFERLNDFDGMLAAGEKALAVDPDSLNTLLALAPAMASRAAGRPDSAQLLARAESYARRALEGVDKIRIPRELPMEQWSVQKRQMQSEAHGVLGLVALQRGDVQPAVRELEMAISLAPKAEGVQFLRLGLALAAAGKRNEAEQQLRRAAELGPDSVHNIALEQLTRLSNRQPSPR